MTTQITSKAGDRTLLKKRIFAAIVDSQDGKPCRPLSEEIEDGRLVSATDNLNRLLADAINNATDTGDILTLIDDLTYCSQQLALAAHAVKKEFVK